MGYCKNCHSIIEDGLRYCEDCARKINEGDYSENYLDNLLKSITDDVNVKNDGAASTINNDEDLSANNTDASQSKDDIDVLEKIFDNFSNENDEDDTMISDGSDMDIEQLIMEGNKYSEEIKNQKDIPKNESMYDEKGNYIVSQEEENSLNKDINDFIDNSSEDDLLNLLNSMTNDSVEFQDNIQYDSEDKDNSFENKQVSDGNPLLNENVVVDESNLDDIINALDMMSSGEGVGEAIEDNSNEYAELSNDETYDSTTSDIINFVSGTEETDNISSDISAEQNVGAVNEEQNHSDDEYSTEEGTVFLAKGKKSIFKKLFGNVPDKKTSQQDNENDKEDFIEDELSETEKKAAKKAEKKKKKQEKAALKKELKERKAKQKIEKKQKALLEVEEDTSHINMLGSIIIFIMAAGICVALIFIQKKFSYYNDIKQCEKYYSQEQYRLAYLEIDGMKLTREEDEELYNKLRTIMYVQQYIDDSDNFFKIELYEKSANSLIIALNNYEKKFDIAKDNGVDEIYIVMYKDILDKLVNEFGIDEKEAKHLLEIEDNNEYTKELLKYTEKLHSIE